jgi:Zn finger protein HypA/HybF involved in hydrogenase expression
MPYWKCISCHHEFENSREKIPLCDWCGSTSYILENKTSLEKMMDDIEKVGGFENYINLKKFHMEF